MTPEQFERVSRLFEEVCDIDANRRQAFLDLHCRNDAEVREHIERMLVEDARGSDAFPGRPTVESPALIPLEEHIKPERIAGYRILGVCGHGGMGTVYEAEQDYPRRRVALKIIRPGVASPQVLRRFRQEAEILGRLQHRAIAQVFEAGMHRHCPFLAMEYVAGSTLDQYAKQQNLDLMSRLELFARICDGVHYAHLKGIVHRDLKPANVLVAEAQHDSQSRTRTQRVAPLGQPKILDFGIARLTDSDVQATTMVTSVGEIVGTVAYMSPEQASGDPTQLDIRSDIYALGVMLFELLSNQKPYDLGMSMIEAVSVIREQDPPRLGTIQTNLRGDVETIVGKCLEKSPERRYQSAADLAADISRYLNDEPILARAPSAIYQIRKFTRRHRILVAGVASTMVALLIGAVIAVFLAIRASNSEDLARYQAYRSSISAASGLVNIAPFDARQYLDEAPEEFRNWEWNYLSAKLSQRLSNIDCGGELAGRPVFTADGKKILYTRTDGAVIRRDLIDGTVESILDIAAPLATSAFDLHGDRLAAAVTGGSIVAYDLTKGVPLDVPALPASPVDRLAWDPSGRGLAGVGGGKLHVWRPGEAWSSKSLPETSTCRVIELAWIGHESKVAVLVQGGTKNSNQVLVVDTETGDTVATHQSEEMVFCLAIAPNAKQIAIGYGVRSIRLLTADGLNEIVRFGGHLGEVDAINWSEDGRWLASAGADDTVRIWDVATGTQRLVINQDNPDDILLSPDATRLIVRSDDQLNHWDASFQASTVMRGHQSYPYNIAYSPDGKLLASSAFFEPELWLWDPIAGTAIASPVTTLSRVLSLTFTHDGTQLLLGRYSGFHRVDWVDPFTGIIVAGDSRPHSAVFQGFTLWDVLHAGEIRDGSMKYLVGRDELSIWRTEFGGGTRGADIRVFADDKALASAEEQTHFDILPHPHPLFIGCLMNLGYPFEGQISEFMLFDRVLAAEDVQALESYLDARRGGNQLDFPQVSSAALVARFVADREYLDLDDNGYVLAWRAANDPEIVARGMGASVANITYHETAQPPVLTFDQIVATPNSFQISERRLQVTLPASIRLQSGTVVWLGNFTDWGYPWGIGLLHEASPQHWKLFQEHGPDLSSGRLSTAQVCHPDGNLRAVTGCRGDDNNGAILLDPATGAWIDELGEGYASLDIHPDGQYLAAAGLDGIHIWDLRQRRRIAIWKGHHTRVYCVDYNPDGSRLASGGNDNTIRIWDTSTGAQLLELRGHEQYVKDLRFSPDGSQIASASGDYTIRIWDSVTRNERRTELDKARSRRAAFAAMIDQRLSAGESPENLARRLRNDQSLDASELRAALRALAARTLTTSAVEGD